MPNRALGGWLEALPWGSRAGRTGVGSRADGAPGRGRASADPRSSSRRTTARPPSSTTSCWGHAFCRLWQCTALRKASLARHCKTLDSGNLHRFQSQNPQRVSSTTHLWQCTALRNPGCRFILESTRSAPERISGSTPRCSAPQSVNESSHSAQRSQSTMHLWQRIALHNPGLS